MVQKAETYKASMQWLKSVFFTNWHCYLIISYQCHIKLYLLGIMVFLVVGRGAENIEKKNKIGRRKALENEAKRIIQGKSNNNNEYLWFYLLCKKYILFKNIVVRGKKVKSSLYHHILFTVFNCRRI